MGEQSGLELKSMFGNCGWRRTQAEVRTVFELLDTSYCGDQLTLVVVLRLLFAVGTQTESTSQRIVNYASAF